MGFRSTVRDLLSRGAAQDALHEPATAAACEKFERQVFVRGVVEVSNFCRENCAYCGMRRDNRSLQRARARHDEIAELLVHHRPAAMAEVNIQTSEDPVEAREVVLPLDGCSVSPFIPGEATPLATAPAGGVETTLNCMAVLRLMRPDCLIPAVCALNLAQAGTGYRRGLRTGANVVTINLTPPDLQQEDLLYKRERFIMDEARVLAAIAADGLEPSVQSMIDYFEQNTAAASVATTT